MKSVFIVCDDKRTLFVLCISIKKIKIKYICSTVDILPTENGIKNRNMCAWSKTIICRKCHFLDNVNNSRHCFQGARARVCWGGGGWGWLKTKSVYILNIRVHLHNDGSFINTGCFGHAGAC